MYDLQHEKQDLRAPVTFRPSSMWTWESSEYHKHQNQISSVTLMHTSKRTRNRIQKYGSEYETRSAINAKNEYTLLHFFQSDTQKTNMSRNSPVRPHSHIHGIYFNSIPTSTLLPPPIYKIGLIAYRQHVVTIWRLTTTIVVVPHR